jgi:4-alpha-glucanotransferase
LKDARRRSGILCHISSLPSVYGIGDLGPSAFQFADFLSRTGQSLWQVLPLGPTDPAWGNSPYSSTSAFAGNHLFLSPNLLLEEGLLEQDEARSLALPSRRRIDYACAIRNKERLIDLCYRRWGSAQPGPDYEEFCGINSGWLDDFALFVAIKRSLGGVCWGDWPAGLRAREETSLATARADLAGDIEREKFCQFQFHRQWSSLRRYCNERGIMIVGDIPIYVSYDSADAWSNPSIFKLDSEGKPVGLAGVPPDYFSETGQLWGNPVYRWDALKETGYSWWIARMAHALGQCDIVRIDHFRGFAGFWEVPAGQTTAVNGKWVKGPGDDFILALRRRFSDLPIIAEDLGLITPDVKEMIKRFDLPGMKVLLFAFGSDDPLQPYLPHNYESNCAVYTGTHDNNTALGWFQDEATPEEKARLLKYLGCEEQTDPHWDMIRLAMMSVAAFAIFPIQDVLGLGQDSRMNLPSAVEGNWSWRLVPDEISHDAAAKLLELTRIYGRANLPAGKTET